MTKTCPACGFVSNAEARFCRMCGALLPRSNDVGDSAVSPHASTVPLSGTDAATGPLSPHDTGSPNRPRTDALRRGEMDELLVRLSDSASRPATGDGSPAATAADAVLEDETKDDGSSPLRIRVRPIETGPSAHVVAANATPSGKAANATPPDDAARAQATNPHVVVTQAPPRGALSDLAGASSDPAAASSELHRASAELHRASSNLDQPDSDHQPLGPDPQPASSAPEGASSDLVRAAPEANVPPQAHSAAPADAAAQTAPATEKRALRLWAGAAVFSVIALVVATVVVLAWYTVHRLRRAPNAPEGATASASASAASLTAEEAKQLAASKLKEADELSAAGRTDEATARLREAAALDPADAESHRRLARLLLLAGGSRRTAIEELQTVTRLAPDDAAAWRDLAAAQSAEGAYVEAAESYHTLFGLSGAGAISDDRLQLAYADALRLSGRTREAQSLYKRLAGSRVAEVARASRQRLADAESKNANDNDNANGSQLASANGNTTNNAARESVPAETARAGEAGNAEAQMRPSSATLPADASPQDHYERGVELWRTNRAAALAEFGAASQRGNADADYYLGLGLAEGREPRELKRGDLVAALTYFQRARRSRFSAEARRYEDALVREYDRRRTTNDQ